MKVISGEGTCLTLVGVKTQLAQLVDELDVLNIALGIISNKLIALELLIEVLRWRPV